MLLTYWPLFTWLCSSTLGSTESVTVEPHLVHCGTNFINMQISIYVDCYDFYI